MKSILLSAAVILAVLATNVQKSEAVGSSKFAKKIFKTDVEDSTYKKENLDLDEKIAILEEVLAEVKGGLGESCKSGSRSAWCKHKRSLSLRKQNGLTEKPKKRSLSRCWWPGLPYCIIKSVEKNNEKNTQEITEKITEKNTVEQSDLVPRGMRRCRPGIAHCPNGKREFRKTKRRAQHCPSGWPWCLIQEK